MFIESHDILSFLGILLVLVYVAALMRVFFMERTLKKLYSEMEEKKIAETMRPVAQGIIDGRRARIEEEYKKLIEPIERNRRYILEKLPFIKQ